MLFRRVVLAVGIVVAAGLPTAGTASAGQGAVAGPIIATGYASGSPALVSLDPVNGDVTRTFAQNAQEGVLSPKGSTVAYVEHDDTCIPQPEGCMYARNLVLAGSDGGGRRVLVPGIQPETNEAPYVGHPDWSPDGKRIVYSSPRGMEWIKSDGTGQEVLTTTGGAGTFSPDGKSIAFVRTTVYETPDGREYGRDVWVMDLATRETRQVSTARDAHTAPVDWSPDGQRIVYVTDGGLTTVDVATGVTTGLQNGWTASLGGIQGPVFSPDGARIAFSALNATDSTRATYVADARDGGDVRLLTGETAIPTDWLNG